MHVDPLRSQGGIDRIQVCCMGSGGLRREGVLGMRSRKRFLAALAVVMAGGMIAFSAPAAFALANTPDTNCFDIRGKVYSVIENLAHTTLYVGGKFSRASLPDGTKAYAASSLTRFDTATCAGDKTFVPTVTDASGTEP